MGHGSNLLNKFLRLVGLGVIKGGDQTLTLLVEDLVLLCLPLLATVGLTDSRGTLHKL